MPVAVYVAGLIIMILTHVHVVYMNQPVLTHIHKCIQAYSVVVADLEGKNSHILVTTHEDTQPDAQESSGSPLFRMGMGSRCENTNMHTCIHTYCLCINRSPTHVHTRTHVYTHTYGLATHNA